MVSTVKIDEINYAIINHLRDGRLSFKKIADSLAVSEGTVRARVKKLKEESNAKGNPVDIERVRRYMAAVRAVREG